MDELYEVFQPPTHIAVYPFRTTVGAGNHSNDNNGSETASLIDDNASNYSYGSTTTTPVVSFNKSYSFMSSNNNNKHIYTSMGATPSPSHAPDLSPMYLDEAATQATTVTSCNDNGSDNYSLEEQANASGNNSIRSTRSEDPNKDPSTVAHPILQLEDDLPENPFESHGKLGTVALAVMVFYSVSGGPFGVESSVRSAGNFYTLLGFIIMPFVWSLQEAFMTAELGSAFPEASGGVAWVEEAFGSRAGWMSGYLGWLAGATDNAIYPVLFLDYVLQVLQSDGDEINPVFRFFLLSSTSLVLALINWLGLPIVGRMSTTICMIAMSPFFVLCIFGAFKVQPSRWFLRPDRADLTAIEDAVDDDVGGGLFPDASLGGILWRPFLNNLFWNLNSFDAAGSFAADIDGDPGKVFPRAMGLSVAMVTFGYLLPLLVTLGASDAKQSDWVDGYLARACSEIVGPWLGGWMVFAAGISNIALFQAELSADAFQLMGMADRGHLPKIFSERSRHGTPTYGILLGTAIIIAMGASHLDSLIEMLNFNYAVALLMEYMAFIKLRISRPNLERPYKIPLNTTCCILALAPTILCTICVLSLATFSTYIFALVSNVVGIFIYTASRPGACRIFASWFACRKKKAVYSVVDTTSHHNHHHHPSSVEVPHNVDVAVGVPVDPQPVGKVDSENFVLA